MTPWLQGTLNNGVEEDHWGWISLGTYQSRGLQSGGLQSDPEYPISGLSMHGLGAYSLGGLQ